MIGWTGLKEVKIQKIKIRQGVVAQACNPIYSGGRVQEDCGSRWPRGKVFETPPPDTSTNDQAWWYPSVTPAMHESINRTMIQASLT
jgi:hypothetical protein